MSSISGRTLLAWIGIILIAGCGKAVNDGDIDPGIGAGIGAEIGAGLGGEKGEGTREVSATSAARGKACGIQGSECDAGHYCNLGVGNCKGDRPGVCEVISEICTQHYDPVCGCDGTTYGNACQAAGAAVSIDYEGACRQE